MHKPIKICYVLPEYRKDTDSHFYHLYELLERLSKKTNELDLFLVIERGENRDIKLGNRTYVQRFKFLPLRFLESFFILLKARILGYKNFYVHYAYIGGINAGIISRLSKANSFYWNCAMNWAFKQKLSSKISFKLCLKLAKTLVTCSNKMKEEHIKHYGLSSNKIKVITNWVNLERFKKQEIKNKKKKTILFVHWLSKRKGVNMIIPIILNLKNYFSNFELLIIGNGPYKDKLLEEIKENKLDKFIKVLGGVPNKEIAKYYTMADVFIMPSREEGFGRVLLEAMAVGIPYVAFDIGSVKEISSSIARRFLVKPYDIEKFAYKIEILFSDRKIYNEFKKEELEKVKEYSLTNTVNKFIKLFS